MASGIQNDWKSLEKTSMPKAISCFQLILFLQIICSASSAVAVSKLIPGNNDTDFEKQVAPILIKRCVECHHSDDPNGGLNLTSDQGFRTGGESAANLLNQNLDENLLIEKISSGEMPPPENGISKELTAAEKKNFEGLDSTRKPLAQTTRSQLV